jgi:folate-binding protein YgfZ
MRFLLLTRMKITCAARPPAWRSAEDAVYLSIINISIVKTPLLNKLEGTEVEPAEYSGVETARSFGDVRSEFEAITGSAGIYDLGWRAKIKATGPDRVRWLNGMVTNNVRDLKPRQGNYNFVLNAQGRIQGDLYAYNLDDQLVLDTEAAQSKPLLELLNRFIIMDDVELTDISASVTSIGIQGPRSTEILKAIGIEPDCADPLIVCQTEWDGKKISITRMADPRYLTYEIWLHPDDAYPLWKALTVAGAVAVGFSALEKFRVFAGVPKYGADIRTKDLPQETGQEHALNFVKGCYIGQEIVERIRSRGAVHRMFSGFLLSGRSRPGAEVKLPGKSEKVGELTSFESVPIGPDERWLGLGYFRRELGGPGTEVEIDGAAARTAQLPFSMQ